MTTFSQVRLLVDDFGAAFRFYRDALGLEVGFGDESSSNLIELFQALPSSE